MLTGRCQCGTVQYELDGEIGVVVNCRCQYCRRAHGAAFVAIAPVRTGDLHFLAGADAVHEVHSQGVGFRAFCRQCATRLYNRLASTRKPLPLDHACAAGPIHGVGTRAYALLR